MRSYSSESGANCNAAIDLTVSIRRGAALTHGLGPRTVATVVYRFDAPPHDVFDAWLDPDFVGKWWFTSPSSEMNTTRIVGRLGGDYEIVDRRDGITYRAIGTFIEFERPRRLAFTFAMPDISDAVDEVTITIEPDGDGSKLTLEHACYRDLKKPYGSGWGTMFRELDQLFRIRATNR
jgi:uncharacterized protein YndB with AHSA1/START domain